MIEGVGALRQLRLDAVNETEHYTKMWGSTLCAPFLSMTYVTLVLTIELAAIGGGLMLLQGERQGEDDAMRKRRR